MLQFYKETAPPNKPQQGLTGDVGGQTADQAQDQSVLEIR
jgi:hypothetical protein